MLKSVLSVAFTILVALPVFSSPPKLVVAIAVDQLRYDYLERFHDQFVPRGFRLLTDKGTFMTYARYDYAPTVTGPGHASFLSGSAPSMHGIIGNDWFDRRTGKTINCVGDTNVTGVGTDPTKAKASPRNFIGGTFADEMRLAFGSKVVGISLKDRAAILPAGKKPLGAFWFESKTGNFVTSSYYMQELPAWLQQFNSLQRAQSFVEQPWDRLLKEECYFGADDSVGEGNFASEKHPIFPHYIATSTNGYDNVSASPFGNELLLEAAKAAIVGEDLGRGKQPDLLCVSFSSIDSIGHRFGPYSQEIQDAIVRLDRQLAELFKFIDRRVGLQNTMIVLTADHAVAPAPEFAREQGLGGQRWETKPFLTNLVAKLNQRFGDGAFLQSTNLYYGNLYFQHSTLREKKISVGDLASFIRDVALESGLFHAVYTRDQLLEGRAPGLIGEMVRNGFHAERSGDMVLIDKPYLLQGSGKTGTTHGSPYNYDSHVPILFYGREFKKGRYAHPFYITDIVPTLCAALGISPPPMAAGKPLPAILTMK